MGGGELRRISRGQWLALAAAILGWMFDGFEQGVLGLVGHPTLVDVLHLKELDRLAADESQPQAQREQARKNVTKSIGKWLSTLMQAGCWGGGRRLVFGWLGDRLGRVRAMVFSVLAYAAIHRPDRFRLRSVADRLSTFFSGARDGREWRWASPWLWKVGPSLFDRYWRV